MTSISEIVVSMITLDRSCIESFICIFFKILSAFADLLFCPLYFFPSFMGGGEALGPPMHSFLWLKFLYDLIITLLAWDSLVLNLTFQDVREGSV